MSTTQPDVLTLAVRQVRLTPKEREVFKLIGQGLVGKEIAGVRGKSIKTIEAQTQSIRRKLGVPNMRAVVIAAVKMTSRANS